MQLFQFCQLFTRIILQLLVKFVRVFASPDCLMNQNSLLLLVQIKVKYFYVLYVWNVF